MCRLLSALPLVALAPALAVAAPAAPAAVAAPAPQGISQDDQSPEGKTVTSIEFQGLEFNDEARLLHALEIKVGQPFDLAAFQRSMRQLWSTFGVLVIDSHTENVVGGVAVTVNVIEEAVDHEARFIGNSEISTKKLLEWAGMQEGAVVYQHEAERIKDRLVREYRRAGHHFIEVDVVMRGGRQAEGKGPLDVIFEIREGPEVRCTGVDIQGNDSLPDTGWGFWSGGLSSLASVKTDGRGMFSWWGKKYDEEVLRADLIAMAQVYRDRGWLDARVELDEPVFNKARDEVKIRIMVDEGPLWHVAAVNIEAMQPNLSNPKLMREKDYSPTELLFDEKLLLELLECKQGVPFEQGRRDSDERALRTYYGTRGYIDSRYFSTWGRQLKQPDAWLWLEPRILHDYERKEVIITYRFFQGRKRHVRDVKFTGNNHTKDRVLRREVSVKPGEDFNIREVERSLARLRGTRYFSDQRDPDHRDPYYVLHETGDPDEVDVEFLVEEGLVVDASLSGGIDSNEGLIGLASISMRNFDLQKVPSSLWGTFGEIYRKEAFHGDGELLNLEIAPGQTNSYGRLRYRHGDIFGSHYDRWSVDMDYLLRSRIFRSHDERREHISLKFGRTVNFNHVFRLGGKYQVIKEDDFDSGILPSTLTGESVIDERLDNRGLPREIENEFSGPTLDYSYSDLDNRSNPRDGIQFRSTNTFYDTAFGGGVDLLKSELFFDYYFELGGEADDVRSSVYIGTSFGIAHPYGDTDVTSYGERFQKGGSTSLRGFRYRGVGPYETLTVIRNGIDTFEGDAATDGPTTTQERADYPTGGETALGGTFEFRKPLYSTPLPGTTKRREMFRLIAFVDWAILDPESFSLDPDELRASYGFGFGLAYPIPLTFNFGFPLLEGDGDRKQVFSFRLSYR